MKKHSTDSDDVFDNDTGGGLTCSKCGHDQFDRLAPKAVVAFARDYRCCRCGHCFPAATPIWASLLFLLGGVPLTLAGLFAIISARGERASLAPLIGAGLLFMGATATWHGGKNLLKSGITIEIED